VGGAKPTAGSRLGLALNPWCLARPRPGELSSTTLSGFRIWPNEPAQSRLARTPGRERRAAERRAPWT